MKLIINTVGERRQQFAIKIRCVKYIVVIGGKDLCQATLAKQS